jgi:hypothetical protein
MPRLMMFVIAALVLISVGASAQTAKDIEGSWTLMSATVSQDGRTRNIFGSNPRGIMSFDAAGRFIQVIVSDELPKFASKSREKGTAEENQAVVQGSIAFFGTYSVDNGGIVTLHIEGSTFPNMSGSDQQRAIRISGDELTWANATPAVGSGTAEQLWKRAK